MRSAERTTGRRARAFSCAAGYKRGVRLELRDVAVTYVLAFAGTAILGAIGSYGGPAVGGTVGGLLGDLAGAGTALLFFGLALAWSRRRGGGPRHFGIDLGGVIEPSEQELADTHGRGRGLGAALWAALPSAGREIGFALLVALIVFPPFVVGFWLWHGPGHPWRWSPPPDLATFALAQIVMVALPEEAFFRGWVQTRLQDARPPTRTLLGARIDPGALVVQSVLFALVHLAAEPRLDELATFFPGLLFGWVRARRDGIGAALVLHALSNLLAEILVRGWLL